MQAKLTSMHTYLEIGSILEEGVVIEFSLCYC